MGYNEQGIRKVEARKWSLALQGLREAGQKTHSRRF
jgi:hypothetical protein